MTGRPRNTLFPLFAHQSPYSHVVLAMGEELVEHVRWFGLDEETGQPRDFYRVENYQQLIVNFAVATIRVAKLHQRWIGEGR